MFVNGSGRNEQSYRWHPIYASYQVSVHLDKRFQRWFFRNQPIRNKNCLCRPYLLSDRNKMCNLYRGPPIDASYQVSVHLAKGFQRRSKCEKLTDEGRQTTDTKWWQMLTLPGKLKKKKKKADIPKNDTYKNRLELWRLRKIVQNSLRMWSAGTVLVAKFPLPHTKNRNWTQ